MCKKSVTVGELLEFMDKWRKESHERMVGLTYKQVCEHIESAKILCNKDGVLMTANEIYEYSPSGELSAIPEWYHAASISLGYYIDKQGNHIPIN